jgi:hypothetical protein
LAEIVIKILIGVTFLLALFLSRRIMFASLLLRLVIRWSVHPYVSSFFIAFSFMFLALKWVEYIFTVMVGVHRRD